MTPILLPMPRNWIYLRYVISSVGALAVDMGLFIMMLHFSFPPVAASALGYLGGVAAHWLLSSRAVFANAVAREGEGRRRQKLLFILSALAGLAITTAIIGAAGPMGIDPRMAKLVAIIVSFQTTYLIRKKVVFAR